MPFDPQKPVDAVFDKFGIDATLDPGGPGERVIRVLADRSTSTGQVAGFDVQGAGGEIRIRTTDASGLAANDRLHLTDPVEVRKLTGTPRYDDRRRLVQIWTSSAVT